MLVDIVRGCSEKELSGTVKAYLFIIMQVEWCCFIYLVGTQTDVFSLMYTY